MLKILNFEKSTRFLSKFENLNKRQISLICDRPMKENFNSCVNYQFKKSKSLHLYDIQKTTLDNGIRVCSTPYHGDYITVGVSIESGSRFEKPSNQGVTHFLEKLAFGSSENYKNNDQVLQNIEKHEGIIDCQSSRDILIYALSINKNGLGEALHVLNDTIFKPDFNASEIARARKIVERELSGMENSQEKYGLALELAHEASFNSKTLGFPKYCLKPLIDGMNAETLSKFVKTHHTPDRMVLTGVGVDHVEFVNLADKYFTESSSYISPTDIKSVEYTGGVKILKENLKRVGQSWQPLPELVHFVIGFNSCSIKDDDYVPFSVLMSILGGGGSFSAGGPGKGMYSRMYTNVLNRNHWVFNATASNHSYHESGAFYIYASAHPEMLPNLTNVLCDELLNVSKNAIKDMELNRAKKQLQSSLMMNLENRPVVFEDISRQMLAANRVLKPEQVYDMIENVSSQDIQRVVCRMLDSTPSIACYGDDNKLPSMKDITELMNGAKTKKRFFL